MPRTSGTAIAPPIPVVTSRASVAGTLGFCLIWIFLILFLVYPLTRIFYDAFTNEAGQFTLENFREFFTDRFYLRSLWNSILLGVGSVITTSVVGIGVAFLLIRYEFPFRNLFSYLTLIPIISPPLVGVLGFVFIMGRAGTVNVFLMDFLGVPKPVNFMYGLHGVLIVETLHLFPMITLNILDALSKVDPSLEEAAESVGARGWRRFWDITLPLTTPGYISGALLVFIWTFADFVTPLVLGVHDLLASQAYLNIVQFVDRRLFRMGIVISALLVVLAIVFLLAARHYVAIKDYSSLAYSKVERRRLGPVKRWITVAFLGFLADRGGLVGRIGDRVCGVVRGQGVRVPGCRRLRPLIVELRQLHLQSVRVDLRQAGCGAQEHADTTRSQNGPQVPQPLDRRVAVHVPPLSR
jgi:iron(III) transport system permease protein